MTVHFRQLRALADLILGGKMQGGDVAYAVAVLIDMIGKAVRIEAHDRHGLERLPRYCARPPFAAERLEELTPSG